MSIINLQERTINAKIVYYGTALGGKTTSLKAVHRVIDPDQKIELVSLNTDKDRTLFFDFLPISLGMIGGFSVRMQGFTVPGQVEYNLTRKYVLTGADAVVLVIDSQTSQFESNLAAVENLKENLAANGLDYTSIPLVLQYNKRDLTDIMPSQQLNELLNDRGVPSFETVALEGRGTFEAFVDVTSQMMSGLAEQYHLDEGDVSLADGIAANLGRYAERSRAAEPEPAVINVTPTHAELAEARPEAAAQTVVTPDDPLPMSEDLLKKAVDSNIEIAQLYAEVNEVKHSLDDRVRELSALFEVGRRMTSVLDVDRLLQTVIESATSCLGSTHGALMLVDEKDDGLIEKVGLGFLSDPLVQCCRKGGAESLLVTLAGEAEGVLSTGEENPEILKSVQAEEPEVRSLMLAPLLSGDRVAGVITIYFLGDAEVGTPEKLRFLSSLASHAALSLENARLVDRMESFNRELEKTVEERTTELRKAYDELKDLDRMKDDFLSSISHELLTPLTSIHSFSEILLRMEELDDKESREEFLAIINQESTRLTGKLKDLLDLSRIEAGKIQIQAKPVALRAVLDGIFEKMGPSFKERDLKVMVICPKGTPPALGDPKWIARALKNILSNAVKFSDEGGEIEIEFRHDDTMVYIGVKDGGCGISDEHKAVIFERFQQLGDLLTDKPAGIGLGLPLTREILERQGGLIWVDSEPGDGSRFVMGLPVADVSEVETPKEQEQTAG